MNTLLLQSQFQKLGARVKVRSLARRRLLESSPLFIDIGRDRRGEFFDIQIDFDRKLNMEILDIQAKDRHLLMMVRQPAQRQGLSDIKEKFLCGFDERHWFVAGIPEKYPVSSVITAKEALKPNLVRHLERGKKGKLKKRQRRKTETFVRQGEWFFIPVPTLQVSQQLVLYHEPIRRGSGKPHLCELLYRMGGKTVYVCAKHPNGLSEKKYQLLLKQNRSASKWRWRVMQRNPLVFVQGKVSHSDHATLNLSCWHRVEMNTENQSKAMESVAFLD